MNTGTVRALWLIAILVLAGACVALSRQLAVERDRAHFEIDHVTQLQRRLDSLRRSGAETVAVSTRPAVADGAKAATTSQREPVKQADAAAGSAGPKPRVDPNLEIRRRQQAFQKAQADMFADPESRKLALSETKSNLRWEFPDVARRLHLSAEEEDQFLDLLANQRLTMWEKSSQARASGQSPMISPGEFEEQRRLREAEITTLLGSQRSQQFKEYQETLPERRRVTAFQATLDEKNALARETAETLISRLADERKTLREKAQVDEAAQPAKMTWGFANGMSLRLDSDEPSSMAAQAAAQMESYDKRMAEVATPLLTAAQLKAFTTFQSERRESLLAQMRMSMLNMRRTKSATPAKPAQ
jgi:hypothetical protein